MKLKICGMKYAENITEAASLQPDYLGFIFYQKSPRFFDGDIPKISDNIRKTGVFVNASLEYVFQMVEKHELQAVQLHGEEEPDFCAALKAENLEVIKVFSVKDEFDFDLLRKYEGEVDFFLFDTKGEAKGGTGKTFNWDALKNYPSEIPFFLSGGIGPEEAGAVREFISYFKETKKKDLFRGIDVNSKFETRPGLKDIGRIKEFKKELPEIG